MTDYKSKYEVIRAFDEWIDSFPVSQRFQMLRNWETAFCVSDGTKQRIVSRGQTKIGGPAKRTPEEQEQFDRAREGYEKDMRQGCFRR